MRPEDAVRLAYKNKIQLKIADIASCYHCGSTFAAVRVKEWIEEDGGETGLCPECWVDSVIPGVVSKEDLGAANKMWFWRGE